METNFNEISIAARLLKRQIRFYKHGSAHRIIGGVKWDNNTADAEIHYVAVTQVALQYITQALSLDLGYKSGCLLPTLTSDLPESEPISVEDLATGKLPRTDHDRGGFTSSCPSFEWAQS